MKMNLIDIINVLQDYNACIQVDIVLFPDNYKINLMYPNIF